MSDLVARELWEIVDLELSLEVRARLRRSSGRFCVLRVECCGEGGCFGGTSRCAVRKRVALSQCDRLRVLRACSLFLRLLHFRENGLRRSLRDLRGRQATLGDERSWCMRSLRRSSSSCGRLSWCLSSCSCLRRGCLRCGLTGRTNRGVDWSFVFRIAIAEDWLFVTIALTIVYIQASRSSGVTLLFAQEVLLFLVEFESRTTEARTSGTDETLLALTSKLIRHCLHILRDVLLRLFKRLD